MCNYKAHSGVPAPQTYKLWANLLGGKLTVSYLLYKVIRRITRDKCTQLGPGKQHFLQALAFRTAPSGSSFPSFSVGVLLLILFILIFKKNFIYFWLRWVFTAARGLSLVAASGGYSSLRWRLLLWSTGSRCTGFSSCGARAQ